LSHSSWYFEWKEAKEFFLSRIESQMEVNVIGRV
jgi:hypothetical protein